MYLSGRRNLQRRVWRQQKGVLMRLGRERIPSSIRNFASETRLWSLALLILASIYYWRKCWNCIKYVGINIKCLLYIGNSSSKINHGYMYIILYVYFVLCINIYSYPQYDHFMAFNPNWEFCNFSPQLDKKHQMRQKTFRKFIFQKSGYRYSHDMVGIFWQKPGLSRLLSAVCTFSPLFLSIKLTYCKVVSFSSLTIVQWRLCWSLFWV